MISHTPYGISPLDYITHPMFCYCIHFYIKVHVNAIVSKSHRKKASTKCARCWQTFVFGTGIR